MVAVITGWFYKGGVTGNTDGYWNAVVYDASKHGADYSSKNLGDISLDFWCDYDPAHEENHILLNISFRPDTLWRAPLPRREVIFRMGESFTHESQWETDKHYVHNSEKGESTAVGVIVRGFLDGEELQLLIDGYGERTIPPPGDREILARVARQCADIDLLEDVEPLSRRDDLRD